MSELVFRRCDGQDPDFVMNCSLLDQDLEIRMGKEVQKDYAQYNHVLDRIHHAVCVYADGQLAGSGALKKYDETHVELKRVFVRPAYQGRGIGTALTRQLIAYAEELGFEEIILESGTPLVEAHHVYEKIGFVYIPNFGPFVGMEMSLCMKYDLKAEYFDVLQEDGTPTGTRKARNLVHRDGDWHRSAHIWLLKDGEILLQRRAHTKDSFPDFWDISCAGHLSSGDTSLTGAVRELREELGLDVRPEELEYLAELKECWQEENWNDRELADVYVLRTNRKEEEMRFQEEEISEIRYVSYAEFFRKNDERDPDMLLHEEEVELLREYLQK